MVDADLDSVVGLCVAEEKRGKPSSHSVMAEPQLHGFGGQVTLQRQPFCSSAGLVPSVRLPLKSVS